MMKIKKRFVAGALVVVLLMAGMLTGCTNTTEPIERSDFYFNTIITIRLYDCEDEAVLDGCFALADHYEKLFSTTIADSDISRINAAGGKPVSVDEDTIWLLEKGLYYSQLSDGKFDITIGELSSLWDFSSQPDAVPSEEDIQEALATVDYHAVLIDGNEVTLTNPNASIDLGGIAKGYIADKMKEYLNEQGVHSGTINLGGNVLVLGPKENGDPYTIGIQQPFADSGTAAATVQVNDETVVSSGVYERYFYVGDKLYHHILDTATGYPYENDLQGITIICKNSVDGDGLSTTCFSMGLDDGMEFIETLEDTEAIFIAADGSIHTTSGIGSTYMFQNLTK